MSEREVPLIADVADILPILKHFLYPRREAFLRELVSNAMDALAKLTIIASTDPTSVDDGEPLRVEISLDSAHRTISIIDNGVGMTEDDVIEYINKLAFSGAQEFLDNYAAAKGNLIGQFGLGFYSSFMVSRQVEIVTRSWKTHASACHWSCDGGPMTQIADTTRAQRGTTVICHLEQVGAEFLNSTRLEQIIVHYFDYAPYPVFLMGRQLNVITAPWHLSGTEREGLPSERYWSFYERLNPGENRPITWFHISFDHPFEVRGLLYVPDRSANAKGNVRLFSKRTLVSDHCEALLPDWLHFLDGVIDTPDLPLNVTRDRFQDDPRVSVLRNHLMAKTIASCAELLARRRRDYISIWEHFGIQLKNGYLEATVQRRGDLSAKLEKLLMFPSSRRPLTTIPEYLERASETSGPTVFYLTDPQGQQTHLELLQSRDREVLFFADLPYDLAVIRALATNNPEWSFIRIDQMEASVQSGTKSLRDPASHVAGPADWERLVAEFRTIAGQSIQAVAVEALPSQDIPAILRVTAADAAQDELHQLIGSEMMHEPRWILVINSNSRLIQMMGLMARRGPQASLTAFYEGLIVQVWNNVRLSAGLLKEESLADAIGLSHEFLTMIATHVNDGQLT